MSQKRYFQRVDAGLRDLRILVRCRAGHADRADDFAADDDRHAALEHAVPEVEQAQVRAALRDEVLEHLRLKAEREVRFLP